MRERPILFSAPMVRAILNGSKTQTRRLVNPQPDEDGLALLLSTGEWQDDYARVYRSPYGQPGARLWVRETWYCDDYRVQSGPYIKPDDLDPSTMVYRASSGDRPYEAEQPVWRPSIHMPRWASRITLEVAGVRVERLQDISGRDARAEGCASVLAGGTVIDRAVDQFAGLWESLNGPGSWDLNPWVWVVEFSRVQPSKKGLAA